MAVARISRPRYWFLLVVVLAAVGSMGLLSSASAQGRKGCTNATVKGAYGFVQSGTVLGQDGVWKSWAAVGRNVFDGKGNFTIAKATVSLAGTVIPVTGAGTYVVNPDCTMTLDATLSTGQPQHRDVVVVGGGSELFTISTDPNVVITGRMVKQGSED